MYEVPCVISSCRLGKMLTDPDLQWIGKAATHYVDARLLLMVCAEHPTRPHIGGDSARRATPSLLGTRRRSSLLGDVGCRGRPRGTRASCERVEAGRSMITTMTYDLLGTLVEHLVCMYDHRTHCTTQTLPERDSHIEMYNGARGMQLGTRLLLLLRSVARCSRLRARCSLGRGSGLSLRLDLLLRCRMCRRRLGRG
jgi:hypothetical protein